MTSSAPSAAHVSMVRSARGGDDTRPDVLRELDRKARDAAGTALDQDRLAARELERVLDRDQGGQTGQRKRSAFRMRQRAGFLATIAALIAIFSA